MFCRLALALVLSASAVASASAQTTPAPQRTFVLSGTVLDASRQPLPGVLVTARPESGAAVAAVTDLDGRFELPGVAPGRYSVSMALAGFASVEQIVEVPGHPFMTVTMQAPAFSENLVVTAARTETPLQSLPIAMTVVTGDELRRQLEVAPSLGDALGKLVPGLAAGSQSHSTFGQTLRGRNVLVMIDGVPQSAIRNVSRDLSTISPSAIERIEVARGATAIYGDGASGGIINIITKRPAAGPAAWSTEIGAVASLTAGDTPSFLLRQDVSGSVGRVAYRVNGALERTTGFFDAEGDRLPPDPHGQGGPADSRSWNVLGSVSVALAPRQQLRLAVNAYDSTQDTAFASDPARKRLAARSVKSGAIAGLALPDPQNARQTLVSLDYDYRAPGANRLHAQAYYRDFDTRFFPFDGRAFPIFGRQIFQSYLATAKGGARLDVETRLSATRGYKLTWGADVSRERTRQPVTLMDPAAFDASGGLTFAPIGGREWVPLMEQRNLGAFAQLEVPAGTRWLFRGGLRAEAIDVEIPAFVTLANVSVDGGTLTYRDALFNGGATFFATPDLQVFGQASQGFAVPDIGLVLRGSPAGASVATLPFEAQTVNSFDLGIRADWGSIRPTLAAFYNSSELGASSGGFNQPVVRAPERVFGVEATLDASVGAWQAGGSATWIEGKSDPNRDDVFTYLNSYRIAPPKLTAYAGLSTGRWTARLQALHSGDRNRFPGSVAFGQRPVSSYTVVDALATLRAGRGEVRVGIDNLFNAMYFVRESQLLRTGANDSYTAARGATLTLGYAISY